MIKELIQSVLDAALFPDVPIYYQRKSGKDSKEYIVYSINGDSPEMFADDLPLTQNATATIRYYYLADQLDTTSGRKAISDREIAINKALTDGGFVIPEGYFDGGDIDDTGYYVTIFECEYWTVV